MKFILSIFFLLVFTPDIAAQKKEFKENTLMEITCLIENPYEFLGKTSSDIISAGRPALIKGGDKWEAETEYMHGDNELNISKTITIGTGCGALLLTVSRTTKLVSLLMFVFHKKAKIKGEDIIELFKEKFSFDKSGNCVAQTKNSEYIALSVTKGAIIILAWDNDKKKRKFEN